MAITWPVTADALTNPAATDKTNSPSHATQHANANDAIEAIEAYLGTNASQTTPTGSGRVLRSTSATASEWADLVLTTDVTGILPVANGGTNASSASITAFNNITGYTAAGATGTTSTNLVFSTSPVLTTPSLGTPTALVLTNATGLPAAAVLAGTFGTGAYVMDTSLTNPLLIGGTTTTSTLILRSTSGVGITGADIIFQVGNNGATEAGRILNGGMWLINDTSNANMTVGLTINQGEADNEAIALKSSDVGHGMTTLAETDTYGTFQKTRSGAGGLQISGFDDVNNSEAIIIWGTIGGAAADTTKTTDGSGIVDILCSIKSGTGRTTPGANENLVAIKSGVTTRFIFDVEGSAHADVEWIAFDTHDDIALLDTLDTKMNKRDAITNAFGEVLKYNQNDLQDAGIVNFYDHGPRAMLNTTRLAMLHTGAIRQLYKKIEEQALKIIQLEQRLLV